MSDNFLRILPVILILVIGFISVIVIELNAPDEVIINADSLIDVEVQSAKFSRGNLIVNDSIYFNSSCFDDKTFFNDFKRVDMKIVRIYKFDLDTLHIQCYASKYELIFNEYYW